MTPHLKEVTRIALSGSHLLLQGNHALVGRSDGDDPYTLSLVDLSTPSAPRCVDTLSFKHSVQRVVAVGSYVYVFEYRRALHIVSIDPAGRLRVHDCHVMFRQEAPQLVASGHWLLAARNWQGVSVFDVSDPLAPRETCTLAVGDTFVDSVAVAGDTVFVAAGKHGLLSFALDAGGQLEKRRADHGGRGFAPRHLSLCADRLWCFGDGPGDSNTLLVSTVDPGNTLWRGHTPGSPTQTTGLKGGGALTFESYRCLRFSEAGPSSVLFTLRERQTPAEDGTRYLEGAAEEDADLDDGVEATIADDARGFARLGQHLIVQHAAHLAVYAIAEHSPLRDLPG